MNCRAMGMAAACLLVVAGVGGRASAAVQPGDTITWVGGSSGDWANEANAWQRSSDGVTGNALSLLGVNNGSEGANTSPTAGKNIVIGGGAFVEYFPASPDLTEIYGDFFIKQGTNLIIRDGAVWAQLAQATWPGVPWTQMDASNLILDGGTFRRMGSAGGMGGAMLLLGSWKADDNFAHLPAPAEIYILITNGGSLENEGDLWFGSGDDTPDDGLHVTMEINGGAVTLTGGDAYQEDQYVPATADLMFTYSRKADFTPVNEQYEINFTGPGSITVDHSGIIIAKLDDFGVWTGRTPADPVTTLVTYEQLWEDGLLKSKGMSGANGSGQAFSNYFTVAGTSGADDYTVMRKDPVVVAWDGGMGEWNDDAKWNGGQTAVATMGSDRGTNGGHAIVLDGSVSGGADVMFDPNPDTGVNGDFEMKMNDGVSSLTIKNGASLTIHSASDVDGKWTRFGGDLDLDGGTFRRTKDNVNSLSGGALIWGDFDSQPEQEIDIEITNGGRLENDGQMWFGMAASTDQYGLEVTVTINGGAIDQTGGDSYPLVGLFEPDVLFYYGRDLMGELLDEKYAINFTGPGSMRVDHSGIVVATVDEFGAFTWDDKTYEELWDLGILQANGLSGLDGAMFGDYFSVAGSSGADDYMLTSRIGGLDGDYNGDGKVDAADYTVIIDRNLGADAYNTWVANFGAGTDTGADGAAAVPEPSTLVLALGLILAGIARRKVRW